MLHRWLRHPVTRYAVAAAAYAALLGATTAFRRFSGVSIDTTALFILAMIASAWYGGRGPGLLVAILFESTLDYFAGFPNVPARYGMIMFNRVVLFACLVLFASARRSAEHRLRAQEARLRAALAGERDARHQAEAAGRAKDAFLAVVSHELRTPLNAIVGWAAILNRHAVDEPTRRQAVEVIERNAQAQSRIVDDVLDFSAIVRGRVQLDPRPLALHTLVAEAMDSVKPAAAAKGLELELAVDSGLMVIADLDRMRQIAWNLCANAIKFTPPGGRVIIRVRPDGSDALLEVEDTGIGIAPEFLPHMFDAFRQQDASMTREHGGLGLGLAIVRHLTELQGGTITASSAGSGRGAAFTVRLPATAVPALV